MQARLAKLEAGLGPQSPVPTPDPADERHKDRGGAGRIVKLQVHSINHTHEHNSPAVCTGCIVKQA